jgi:UDP-2,4-diacetamido-2,4,6-trideoxy-beta-L-altropyranose hydrolase
MNVLIRADSSSQMGLGHLMRCRSLARELLRNGHEVTFVCRELPGHQTGIITAEGFATEVIPWEGRDPAPEAMDFSDTVDAIDGGYFDCVVVDHYSLGRSWEAQMQAHCDRLVVIDDLANRSHSCDFLLDQNVQIAGRYDSYAPNAIKLLGPRYALLDRSFLHQRSRVRTGIDRILIFFGGGDTFDLTSQTIESLSAWEFANLNLDVVVGPSHPRLKSIESLISSRGNASLYPLQPSLAGLMNDADLSIGAGGSTNWERLYSGLPTIVVSVADNQIGPSEALAQAGLISYIGSHERISDIARVVREFLLTPQNLAAMSEAGPLCVDGYGALRAAEVIAPTGNDSVSLRPARLSDAVVYFAWANETEARQNSLSVAAINWNDHEAWFRNRISSRDSRLFVLETSAGLPIGQIRFDRLDNENYRLSYALDPLVRGRGLAKIIIARGMQLMALSGASKLVAEVKAFNTRSVRVFEGMGFRSEQDGTEVRRFTVDLAI